MIFLGNLLVIDSNDIGLYFDGFELVPAEDLNENQYNAWAIGDGWLKTRTWTKRTETLLNI